MEREVCWLARSIEVVEGGFFACVQQIRDQKHHDREEVKAISLMLLVAFRFCHWVLREGWHRICCRCDAGLPVHRSVLENRYLSDTVSAREQRPVDVDIKLHGHA
jgi:hypothetical protein